MYKSTKETAFETDYTICHDDQAGDPSAPCQEVFYNLHSKNEKTLNMNITIRVHLFKLCTSKRSNM